MKIAIISDTHDNFAAVGWIIEYLNAHHITTALHAGDIINPGIIIRFRDHFAGQLHFVFGNNDGEQARLQLFAAESKNLHCHREAMELELEGKRIFMNHYSSMSELVCQSGKFDVCIGGHDHRYRVTRYGQSLFINPGNAVVADKWDEKDPSLARSFVILDLSTLEAERIMLPEEFQSK